MPPENALSPARFEFKIRSQALSSSSRGAMSAVPKTQVSYVSRQEIHDNKVPLDFRDYCAHLLIPLNRCRNQMNYLPWECVTLRNAYEKCQYNDYERRRDVKKEMDRAAKAEREAERESK